jgi:hypothetical protein
VLDQLDKRFEPACRRTDPDDDVRLSVGRLRRYGVDGRTRSRVARTRAISAGVVNILLLRRLVFLHPHRARINHAYHR